MVRRWRRDGVLYPLATLVRLWGTREKGITMKKTVGSTDKVVRGVLSIVLLVIAGFAGFSSAWGIVLVIVAAVLVVTAATGYCPFYSATGLNTLGEHEHRHEHRHDASAH